MTPLENHRNLGRGAQRSQFGIVFRHGVLSSPYVIAGQVHMLPTQRGEVSQQVVGDVLRLTQRGDGALEVSRVPEDDRGDEEVEAGSSVLLVFISAIADFAERWMKTARARLLRASPLLSSWPVVRRSSGSSIQSRVNRVRSSRPSSRSAEATPFCRG